MKRKWTSKRLPQEKRPVSDRVQRRINARTESIGRPCKRCGADEWRVGKIRRWAPCHRRSSVVAARRGTAWDPRRALYQGAQARAFQQGIDFSIKIDDIVISNECPVLKIPMFRGKGRWIDNSPSLDRLDPKQGYTPENVRVISYRANRLKSDGTEQEHTLIAAWMRQETKT